MTLQDVPIDASVFFQQQTHISSLLHPTTWLTP